MKIFLIGASLLATGSSLISAESIYVEAQPRQIMFHVDRLPVDRGARVKLSRDLTTLAKRKHHGGDSAQRLTAQLLMLAMRLDLENVEAHELNQNLALANSDSELSLPSQDQVNKAKIRIQMMLERLLETDQASEAQVLAHYLKDVLYAHDPYVSLVIGHNVDPTRWQGILPDPPVKKQPVAELVPDHQDTAVTAETNSAESASTAQDPIDEVQAPEKKEEEYTRWNAETSALSLPLLVEYKELIPASEYQIERSVTKNATKATELKLQITPNGALDSTVSLIMEPALEAYIVEGFKGLIKEMMNSRFGKFESVTLRISTRNRLHSNSRSEIILPMALQLKASAEKRVIKPGSLVLGRLDGDRIRRNWDSWSKLKKLLADDAPSGRLVVPVDAEADFVQLLALREESFFVRNEVLMAENLEQGLEMLAESSNTDINEAAAEFAKIQDLIGEKSVGPYSVDKKMRARLELILSKNPNHLSAKMILLRGDNTRSKRLGRYFIAWEASQILNRIGWLKDAEVYALSEEYLSNVVNDIEEYEAEYRDLTDTKDRDIVGYLSNIAETCEVLIRNKKKSESRVVLKAIKEAQEQLGKQFSDTKTVLDEIFKEGTNARK